jgi:hypothetical protein
LARERDSQVVQTHHPAGDAEASPDTVTGRGGKTYPAKRKADSTKEFWTRGLMSVPPSRRRCAIENKREF